MQVNLLLIVGAERRTRRLTDDRDDRLVVHFRVIETIEQMDGARTGRCQAYADLTAELRMPACHERAHLLMPSLYEPDAILRAFECAHESVDAITGVTVDSPHAPIVETLNNEVGNCLSHALAPSRRIRNTCKPPA